MQKTDKELLEEIKIFTKQIKDTASKKGSKDFSVFYDAVAFILNTKVSQLSSKELAENISKQLRQILISGGSEEKIVLSVDTVINIIDAFLKTTPHKQTFINPARIEYTDRYNNDLQHFDEKFQRQIKEKELLIIQAPNYMSELHEKMMHAKWKGYNHARVGGFRIMYHWYPENRLLVYEAIIDHRELERA